MYVYVNMFICLYICLYIIRRNRTPNFYDRREQRSTVKCKVYGRSRYPFQRQAVLFSGDAPCPLSSLLLLDKFNTDSVALSSEANSISVATLRIAAEAFGFYKPANPAPTRSPRLSAL